MAWNFETLGVSSAWDVHGMHPGKHALSFSRGCVYESLLLFLAVKQKFGDKDLDDESESSSSESEDEDARVSFNKINVVC